MRQSYFRLRETTFDLYTEAERLSWYYKACSTLSAWMVLAGYILFAISFTSPPDDLRLAPTTISILGATGIVIGYVSNIVLALLSRSLLFTFDGVLLPTLTASAMGIFTITVNRILHERFDPHMNLYVLLPIVTAAVATIISAILAFVVFAKLKKIKNLDARRRSHLPHSEFHPGVDTPMLTPGHRRVEDMVPDDEAQRRQLLRLLLSRDKRAPSEEIDLSATYHIGLPWETGDTAQRGRSSSVPSQAKTTHSKREILKAPFARGRDRSRTTGSNGGSGFKDPRERRREEIERSTLSTQPSRSPEPPGSNLAWYGNGYSPPSSSHYNNGGGGRYA